MSQTRYKEGYFQGERAMSDFQVQEWVLATVRQNHTPMPVRDLFERMSGKAITPPQGRRALLHLVDEHQLVITSDRKLRISPYSANQQDGVSNP